MNYDLAAALFLSASMSFWDIGLRLSEGLENLCTSDIYSIGIDHTSCLIVSCEEEFSLAVAFCAWHLGWGWQQRVAASDLTREDCCPWPPWPANYCQMVMQLSMMITGLPKCINSCVHYYMM